MSIVHVLLGIVTLTVFAAADVVQASAAGPEVRTERSSVSLISDRSAISPGTSFWIGLRFKLAPGWHTYWRNPGDAGNPAKITWDLPDGVVAGMIRWPYPERISTGPLMSFGYEDEVVLLTRMSAATVPHDAATLAIRADATWLVCADICVPEKGRLVLELPVSAHPKAATMSERIGHFIERLPGPTLNARTSRASGGKIQLSTTVPVDLKKRVEDVWFFPGQYGVVEHPAPQPWHKEDGAVHVLLTPGELPLQPSLSLEGLLAVKYEDGSESSWRITASASPDE